MLLFCILKFYFFYKHLIKAFWYDIFFVFIWDDENQGFTYNFLDQDLQTFKQLFFSIFTLMYIHFDIKFKQVELKKSAWWHLTTFLKLSKLFKPRLNHRGPQWFGEA